MNRNRANKTDKTWRLILVGNHGSIVPLGSIKTLLISLMAGLVLFIFLAAGLGYLYVKMTQRYSQANGELEQRQEELRTLRDKRDMLMARLVIAESKLRSENEPSVAPSSEVPGISEKSQPSSDPKSTLEAEKGNSPKPSEPTDSNTSISNSVLVSDFNISHSRQSNTIAASYTLKNTSPGPKRLLSGKCVLLLKGRIAGEVTTFPVPNVPWENGKPSAKLGAPFYIRNFMTVKLSRSGPDQAFHFDRGIVYVFENSGKILLKKEFPIDLKIEENINNN